MFDIGWGELLLIGTVALVVIGPKDLPKALRTVGRATAGLKRMASEFQGHFHEVLREAEIEDIKKSVSEGHPSSLLAPITTFRDDMKRVLEMSDRPADASHPSMEPLSPISSAPVTESAPNAPPPALKEEAAS